MDELDLVLRRALMDANLADFRPELETAEEPVFSPQYRRRRKRLLAAPFRRARPQWKQTAERAACVLLACAIALGGAMAASPTVRAAVLGWLREISGGRIAYLGPEDQTARVYEETPSWRPTWLPEGWSLDGINTTGVVPEVLPGGFVSRWIYENGGEELAFACYHSTKACVGMALGVERSDIQTECRTTVWGREADFYADSEGDACLVWTGDGGELFQLKGPLDRAELEQVAEHVAEAEAEPLPVYRLGWVPAGSGAPYARSEAREAVCEQFDLADGTICDWMYAAASVCPLTKPEGRPEVVDVRGTKGRFWGPTDPEDNSGVIITIGSTGESRRIAGSGLESTLLWADPDTGITFRIQGPLEKQDILHIAEGIILEESTKK